MNKEATIPNYPDYIVYSDGKVYSKRKKKFMKSWIGTHGYPTISLVDKEGNHKFFTMHRLLATLFIPNPENKPYIDHINTIRNDYRLENLRWVTGSENNLNPITKQRMKEHFNNPMKGKMGFKHHAAKAVYCYGRDGKFVGMYEGIHDASRKTNINRGDIGACCRGKRKTAGNYIWSYEYV